MRKFLLVVFIGMVLAISMYGIIEENQNDSYIDETTIRIHVE